MLPVASRSSRPSESTAPSAWQASSSIAEPALRGDLARAPAGRPGSRRCGPAGARRSARPPPPRPLGVEVEGDRVDVAEDRLGALVEQAVGGGDEAERAGDDLVALAPAQRADAEVERGRAARDRDRVVVRRASRRSRARTARASGPARAGRSERPRAPAPPRAAPRSGRASGIGSFTRGGARCRPSRVAGAAGRRTRASRPAPPTRPR